jgi:hypothetical protein
MAIVCLLMLFLASSTEAGTKLKLLVPAYIPLTNIAAAEQQWNLLIDSHVLGQSEIMIIANINSGPLYPNNWSPEGRAMYNRVFARAAAKGVPIVGYVSTRYGTRPSADVQADIRNWKVLWGTAIKGVFLDEQSTSTAYLSLYQSYRQVTLQTFGASGQVVTNPGTWSPSVTASLTQYLTANGTRSVADVMVILENSGSAAPGFYSAYSPSVWKAFWSAGFAPDRFAVVIHSQPSLQFLQLTSDDAVRWVYVTNRTPGQNAYGGLPSYWTDEVNRVRQINQTASGRSPATELVHQGRAWLDSVNLWLENASVMQRSTTTPE